MDRFDTVMHNKYDRQPEKLKAWLAASRVHRSPQWEKKAEGAATPPPKPPGA